jgi:hypothetical protein
VTEDAGHISVVTGPVKFTVRKAGFNGFDEAWLDTTNQGRFDEAHRIVVPGAGGLRMRAGGAEFLSRHDTGSAVAVEEQAPGYVVLKATGTLTAADGRKGFAYTCRLTAYANQPRVTAQVTVVNSMGPRREDAVSLEELAWELPTALKSPRARVGGEREVHEARLAAGQAAWIHQSASDAYTLGGAIAGTGGGKSSKTLTTGWADIRDGRHGVAAGVRGFWQMHPKGLEATGNGALRVDLYPRRHAPLDLYTGVSRTHDLLFLFHDDRATPASLRDSFAAFQQPLRATAPPRWYCRDTRAFGDLVEADPALFGQRWPVVDGYLKWWTANFENIVRLRDGRTFRGITRDAYGWLEFGDGLHWVWQPGNDSPRNFAWDGNYYDFPHACLLHFLMTGRAEYFEVFVEHSRHLADVHLVHHDPDATFIGSNRYCPPTDHVRMDPPGGDFQRARVYVSDTFNHHKTQSLFESYLLTGDRRALDAALLGLKYAHDYTDADNAYNQPRGPGNQLLTLVTGYEFTGDRKYLDRCRRIVEFGRQAQARYQSDFNNVPSSRFQFGIALEGLRRYYEASGDVAAIPILRTGLDFLIERNQRFTNCADACAFLYRQTGDRKYLDFGLQLVGRSDLVGNPVKDTAITFRSAPYFFPVLAQ